jgi:2-oxoglutarate ferredoxin oxidoreductase subunit alpha
MSVPGFAGGQYVATGLDHDETGDPGNTPDLAMRTKRKRYRKLETLLREQGDRYLTTFGDEGEVEVGIIAFGSTEGAIREATERARADGYKVAHLHVRLLNPLPTDRIMAFAARCRRILVPELNFTGQFAGWLRSNMDIAFTPFHKDEGIPFVPNEIYQQIMMLAASVEVEPEHAISR